MKSKHLRAFTLLESIVTLGVFSTLLLVIATTTIEMQGFNANLVARTDLSVRGGRVLRQVRRELRQSGWQDAATDRVAVPATPGGVAVTVQESAAAAVAVLSFQRRVALGSASSADDWGPQIVYTIVPAGTFAGVAGAPNRFTLQRSEGGLTTTVASNVSALSVTRAPNDDTILVEFEVLERDPRAAGGASAQALRRRYRSRILLLNPQPES